MSSLRAYLLGSLLCLGALATYNVDARACADSLIVEDLKIQEYKIGNDDIIKRACFNDSDRFYHLVDVSPEDGVADVVAQEGHVANAILLHAYAMNAFQEELGKKNKDSEYYCENGVLPLDVLKVESCWLLPGKSAFFKGESVTAEPYITTQVEEGTKVENPKSTQFFKVSIVVMYRCNGAQEKAYNVSMSYDVKALEVCKTNTEW